MDPSNSGKNINLIHVEKCIDFMKKFINKRKENALYFLKIYYCVETYAL